VNEVWRQIDKRDRGHVDYEKFWVFINKHCNWVRERDCGRVFDYFDMREKDRVTWKSFMKYFRGSRDFERDLEELIYELGGRSVMKSRITGLEAWQEMDILDTGKIRTQSFKDFCKDIKVSRRDAREVWRMIDQYDSGRARQSEFHKLFPKKEDFVKSIKKLLRGKDYRRSEDKRDRYSRRRERRHGERRHRERRSGGIEMNPGDICFADLNYEEFAEWLHFIGPSYYKYVDIFRNHGITAKELISISERDLKFIVPNETERRMMLDKALNPDQEILRELFGDESSVQFQTKAYYDDDMWTPYRSLPMSMR